MEAGRPEALDDLEAWLEEHTLEDLVEEEFEDMPMRSKLKP